MSGERDHQLAARLADAEELLRRQRDVIARFYRLLDRWTDDGLDAVDAFLSPPTPMANFPLAPDTVAPHVSVAVLSAADEAALYAVVRAAIQMSEEHRADARCWDCGALNRHPETHAKTCIKPHVDALSPEQRQRATEGPE